MALVDQERIMFEPVRVILSNGAFGLGVMVYAALAVLLGFKSVICEVTEAELLKFPSTMACARILIVADTPLNMLPRFQVTTPFAWLVLLPGGDWMEMTDKPDASESVTTTPVAVDGPRFVTVIVKVTLLVTRVEAGDAMFEIARSAAGLTEVVACVELLAKFESNPAELVTVAMFVMVPAFIGVTVIVTEAVPLLPSAPRLHVTMPFA